METPQKKPDGEEAHPSVPAGRLRAEIEVDPFAQFKAAIFRRLMSLGIPGIVLLVLLIGWLKWDELERIPGVADAADYISERIEDVVVPLPLAMGDRFAVAIARLDSDKGNARQHLLSAALGDRKEIETLVLDRTIAAGGSSKPQEEIRTGDARARKLLRQIHADVMIWGQVLRVGSQSTLKLHWTSAKADSPKKSSGLYSPEQDHDLDLPEPFWKNLGDVLGMIVAAERARA